MPSSFPLHFGSYRELASAIAARVAELRRDDPLEAWGEEVLVASSGVAQAIARELASLSAGRGGVVAGLQLQTVEAFARRIVNAAGEFPRVASDAERRLAMRAAVRAIDDPIAQSRGIGAMLERSYRDMRDSGLTIAEFRRRAQKASLRNSERTRTVVRAWTEYERIIAQLGAADAADVFTRAAQLIVDGAEVRPQIVAGFYDLTGVQRSVIEALARAGKIAAIHVPAGEGDAYAFARPMIGALSALGGVRTPASGQEVARLRGSDLAASQSRDPGIDKGVDYSVAQYDRRDEEIRGVCERIAGLFADGVPPSSIGIVGRVLDEADVHLFNRFAAQSGFATAAAEELPLIAHRIGRAAATILRLRDSGFPRADVLEIVRDGFRARTRINVDKADEVARRYRIAAGASAELRSRAEKSLAIGDYVNLVSELEELTAPLSSPALRGSQWSDLLTTIASHFSPKTNADLVALEQIDGIAAVFARADRTNVRFDATAVIEALEQCAISAAPPTTERPVIWLGDVMRFRGRSFEHLFAVRMQDEILPQRRIEDPLVPDADRRRLGIREIGDGRDEERLLFQLIADGTSSLHFSFAGTDGFGKVLRPSQLLKNFVIERQPERKQELLADFSKARDSTALSPRQRGEGGASRSEAPGEGLSVESPLIRPSATFSPADAGEKGLERVYRQLQLIVRSGTNGPFDGFIADPILRERFIDRLRHISPSRLEDFGECPQKFLLRQILDVKDVDDPDRDLQINAREKGSLDHRILEHLYRGLSESEIREAQASLPQLPPWLIARIEKAIDDGFDEFEAETPAYNRAIRSIERRVTKANLRDFVAADLGDLARTGLRPRWFEYAFGSKYANKEGGPDHAEPFVIAANDVPLQVDGQVDRIDAGTADGAPRYRIVDYKSGKALRHQKLSAKIATGVRLQLALYALAVAEFFGAGAASVSGTIKPLVVGDSGKFDFELAEHEQSIRETLDIFAASIAGGMFPAYPDDREIDSCKYCPVNQACRTKHDVEEKYAVLKAGDPRTLLRDMGVRR